MRNEFQLYANHPAASPGGRLSPPSGALSVLSSPVHLQFIHYVKAQFATQAELCPATVCVTSELRRAVEERTRE